MLQKCSIFLDTSALVSGLYSPYGASGFILSLFKARVISLTISPDIIEEAHRTIASKFPQKQDALFLKLNQMLIWKPTIVTELTTDEIRSSAEIIQTEDVHVVASALKSNTLQIISLDKRFQSIIQQSKIAKKKGLTVLLPSEFVMKYKMGMN